mmetsp:Transcript_12210/g.18907  ORF Transcript_12210/g.18907 Transcript_12210/m.18907 type:complete len:86 (+) Transcript_12210:2408-2665(+)
MVPRLRVGAWLSNQLLHRILRWLVILLTALLLLLLLLQEQGADLLPASSRACVLADLLLGPIGCQGVLPEIGLLLGGMGRGMSLL